MRNQFDRLHLDRGVAIVELTLCLPLLLLLFIATLELAELLRVSQLANVLSRESGNVAFRNCSDYFEATEEATRSMTENCLRDALLGPSGVQAFASVLHRSFDTGIIVSVFRYDDQRSPGRPSLWRVASVNGCAECGFDSSKFAVSESGQDIIGPSVTIPASEIMLHRRIVVSEVFVRYQNRVPAIFNRFVPTDDQGRALYYEATSF